MKYGDTLRQRSIPEWAHFNIDYDYLKDLIKHHTTPGGGKAVSIPGQGDTTERAFGQVFFHVLQGQHDRINLFITSKSGEIERRLDYITQRISQIYARRRSVGANAGTRAKTIEKYAKLDADVTKAGEEIRSLARFRTVQKTGFYKILKKYKRWTRDTELEHRFAEEVSGGQNSFFQLDLGYLLDQYIDVLRAIRTPLESPDTSSLRNDSSQQSSASRLSSAVESGSDLDFDIALATIPLGSRGSNASYWVHADHIVEVEVLLLQHMRLRVNPDTTPTAPSIDSPSTRTASRKSSTTRDKSFGNQDDVGRIVLDQLESFVTRQNASTISSSEAVKGVLGVKAPCCARWTSSGEAAVVVGLEPNAKAQDPKGAQIAKLKRKSLPALLDTMVAWKDDQAPDAPELEGQRGGTTDNGLVTVRQWLEDHSDIRPLAGICSKRTRFVGLHNNPAGGMWATLDRDVFMKDSIQQHLQSNEWTIDAKIGSSQFPHAVLEIRREGIHSPELIPLLDRSHLVERVRGFSLETHAVWTCCKPKTMSPPTWTSLLAQDIRKLPAPAKRQRRKMPSVTDSRAHSSPSHASPPSATSFTDGESSSFAWKIGDTPPTSASELIEPPPLQAFRKKPRGPFSDHPLPSQPEASAERQGYWNEYDNPESEDDGYYIYLDPDASSKFPGQEFFETWTRKTREFLGLGQKSGEETRLLSSADGSSSDEDTADESYVGNYGTIAPSRRGQQHEGYFSGLFRSLRHPHRDVEALRQRQSLVSEIQVRSREREMAKLQVYVSCLGAGLVLDIVLGVLMKTSRRRLRGQVDVAIIFGVICNLLLLLVAVVNIRTRQDRLSWIHHGAVYLVVIALVAADILFFQWALNV